MRKYILTLGQSDRPRWRDYAREPLPSEYAELPFDNFPRDDFEIEYRNFCLSGGFPSGKKNIEDIIKQFAGTL
jgi:hypothetical protein